MAAYIVLSPANGRAQDPDCLFIRDGFSWTAAIFPALHALFQRQFVDAIVLFVLRSFGFAFMTAGETQGAGFILLAASSLVYGFEARNWLATRLLTRGWKTERVMTAVNLAEAEAIYYGEAIEANTGDPVFRFDPDATGSRRRPSYPALQLGMIDVQKGR
jgi:hypothetical protein